MASNILFVDAYDSFSSSIVALLYQLLNAKVTRIQIDSDVEGEYLISKESFFRQFDAIVLGPGPGHPELDSDVGLFKDVWSIANANEIPVLGICLGFQSLCSRYGLKIERLPLPCHGHAKRIIHWNNDIFRGIGEISATQYNSLGVRARSGQMESGSSKPRNDVLHNCRTMLRSTLKKSSLETIDSDHLELLAVNDEGYAMAVRHKRLPLWGFQFHPESCTSSDSCQVLVQRWIDQVEKIKAARRHEHKILDSTACKAAMQDEASRSRHDDILCHLRDLSQLSTNVVTHTCITPEAPIREQIANLCYASSKSIGVAMLESTKGGRFSIYGMPDEHSWRIELTQDSCSTTRGSTARTFGKVQADEILAILERFMSEKRARDGQSGVPFWGGLIGFQSYEFGLELLKATLDEDTTAREIVPRISLMWIDRSIVIDNLTGGVVVQSLRKDDAWVQRTASTLTSLQPVRDVTEDVQIQNIISTASIKMPEHDQYISEIESCRSELLSGNSYELCLTTEATITTQIGPDNSYLLYKNLQRHNPVPYAAFLELGGHTLISSSPEKFLEWSQDGVVDMKPMKGTVRKSSDMTLQTATEILSSPKERAENIMIADLIRHDLFNAMSPEKVKVEVLQLCEVKEFERVYQMISHIRATVPKALRRCRDEEEQLPAANVGCKVLRHTLPPGSMTGAPKKRSCEILSALERRPRGMYSGVFGFMDVGGRGSWSVCIRSAFSSISEDVSGRRTWHVGAGGAITVLSDTEAEWLEMMTKLNNVLGAFR